MQPCIRRPTSGAYSKHVPDKGEWSNIVIGTILIVVLVLALIGALPRWSHSREWGYAPTGGLGLVLVIIVVLVLLGRI